MSVLAGATPSDGSLISGIYDDELAFAFASQEEIDSEIQDSTLSCTSKRDRAEAFGKQDETELERKFSESCALIALDPVTELVSARPQNELALGLVLIASRRPRTWSASARLTRNTSTTRRSGLIQPSTTTTNTRSRWTKGASRTESFGPSLRIGS